MVSHRKSSKIGIDIYGESWESISEMRNSEFPTMADVILNIMYEHTCSCYARDFYLTDIEGNAILPEDWESEPEGWERVEA